MLSNPGLRSPLGSDQTELVMNLLRSINTDQNSFIRSSCYSLWAAFLDSDRLLGAAGLLLLEGQVTSCLLSDQEAVVRRAAVDVLTKLASTLQLLPTALLQVGTEHQDNYSINKCVCVCVKETSVPVLSYLY